MKNILLFCVIVFTLVSCNKDNYVIEYSVDCGDCLISYWDENSIFVDRIEASGNWKYSFEAPKSNKLSVAAQSQLCLDTAACGDTIQLKSDSVHVTIKVDGNVEGSASAGNKEFAAAWVQVFLD